MTEEINNLNTDMKELFTENKYEELIDLLNETSDATVVEITEHNYSIIKKYYDEENFKLIFQYIRFTAFTSFLCEYTYKRQLFTEETFQGMTSTFDGIHEKLMENR